MDKFVLADYRVAAIELTNVAFDRSDTEYKRKGASELEYRISKISVSTDEVVVGTEYVLSLTNGEDELLADLSTKYLVTFGSTRDGVGKVDESELQEFYRAAAVVAHPYHRHQLISLMEPSDLPVFRLPLTFEADEDMIVDPADELSPVTE